MDSSEIIPKVVRKGISNLLVQDKRLDGRGLTEYRPIKVETGIIDKAAGSALVSLGKTKVLVGVKVETGEPFSDSPDEGALTVNAELLPLASPVFEPGPPDENSIELARIVDRGVRESKAVDLKELCIVHGKKVFVVYIDIYILDHDGNLIDASAIASIAALINSKMSNYTVKKDGELEYTSGTRALPLQNYPIAVTMAKIDGKFIVDPSLEEEKLIDARLTIALDQDGNICAMQKGGIGTFSTADVLEATKIAREKSGELRKIVLGK